MLIRGSDSYKLEYDQRQEINRIVSSHRSSDNGDRLASSREGVRAVKQVLMLPALRKQITIGAFAASMSRGDHALAFCSSFFFCLPFPRPVVLPFQPH